MDKETLSNYGWIVICVMVLAVMLAFASPFGNFVANAIKSTTQGLFDTNQNALDSAGIEIMEQEFEEMLNGPSATDSPVKFGQPYQITMDGMLMEYVFYADGSATMWMADAMAEYMPAGSFTYTATEVIMGEDPLSITPDGTTLYDPNDETLKMTVKSVSKGSPKTNTAYVADPNGLVGVTGVDIQIGTDGSITIYQNGVAGETIPASSIQWYENYYTIDGEIAGAIYPDGSKITIDGIVCVIVGPSPLKFGEIYNSVDTTNTLSYVFYESGALDVYQDGALSEQNPAGTLVYAGNRITMTDTGDSSITVSGIVSQDGQSVSLTYTFGSDSININFVLGDLPVAPPETPTALETTPYSVTLNAIDGCEYSIDGENWQDSPVFENLDEDTQYTLYARYKATIDKDASSSRSVKVKTAKYNSFSITASNKEKIGYTDAVTDLVIPETFYDTESNKWYKVTFIDARAFMDCTNIVSVTIPDTVTGIYIGAFKNCTSLENVILPKNTSIIYDEVFRGCTSLKEISIPESVHTIAMASFMDCKNLTTVSIGNNSKLTSIYLQAFYNCENLTSIYIPSSVTEIKDLAFAGCKSLSTIEFGINSNLTGIGQSAFYGSALTKISIPETVTTIGSAAFAECTKLTTANIPSGVTSISNQLFDGCQNLTSIIIPDGVTSIGNYAFRNCASLVNAIVPNSVSEIGRYAFAGCSQLTNINIPSGIKIIKSATFYNCNKLSNVTIPNSVETIENDAFEYCTNFTSIIIPENVTSIGRTAFFGCDNLTSVTFKNTNGWWTSNDSTATSGTTVDVSNPADAAYLLCKANQRYQYWFCTQ